MTEPKELTNAQLTEIIVELVESQMAISNLMSNIVTMLGSVGSMNESVLKALQAVAETKTAHSHWWQ